MKAVELKAFGLEHIRVVEIPTPQPVKGQVLVKVFASSVNPFDVKFAGGMMPKANLPTILGGDVAGVVTELGEEAIGFSVGNNVYGSASALAGGTGAFAEFAAIPVKMLSLMPTNMGFKEAASSVLAGVSAMQALVEHLKLQKDQTILIHGGAGGIGSFAIQIAKAIGASVIATATGEGVSYVKTLGTDRVIDYKKEDFTRTVSGVDAVFDTVGGETYQNSFKVMKKGGVIVSMLMANDEALEREYGVTTITQFTQVTNARLVVLKDFIERKEVKVHIDKVFSLDRIKEAYEAKEESDVLGKIAIEVER